MSVFRIAQGFLQLIRQEAGAKELEVRFEGDPERLTLHFVAHGMQAGARWTQGLIEPRVASIALRLRKLNGTLQSEATKDSVTIQVQIPADVAYPPLAA